MNYFYIELASLSLSYQPYISTRRSLPWIVYTSLYDQIPSIYDKCHPVHETHETESNAMRVEGAEQTSIY